MSSQQDTFKSVFMHVFFASFDVLPGSNLLTKVGHKHTHALTHTQRGLASMAKSRLDYCWAEYSHLKVCAMAQVNTPGVRITNISGFLQCGLWHGAHPACLCSQLNSLAVKCAETKKWFSHLRTPHSNSYITLNMQLPSACVMLRHQANKCWRFTLFKSNLPKQVAPSGQWFPLTLTKPSKQKLSASDVR